MEESLIRQLRACPARAELVHHRLFREVGNDDNLSRGDVAEVLQQWWHPLHYFPDFLSRSISVFDNLEHKTFVADILNEELGDGDPALAHERIFVSTMEAVGFPAAQTTQAAPYPQTARLLESYRKGSETKLGALGCAFATEVADLAMVGGIGKMVRRVTGATDLPWVDIHIQQEPNHVDKMTQSLSRGFNQAEVDQIVAEAESHWTHWCDFFNALYDAVRAPLEYQAVPEAVN